MFYGLSSVPRRFWCCSISALFHHRVPLRAFPSNSKSTSGSSDNVWMVHNSFRCSWLPSFLKEKTEKLSWLLEILNHQSSAGQHSLLRSIVYVLAKNIFLKNLSEANLRGSSWGRGGEKEILHFSSLGIAPRSHQLRCFNYLSRHFLEDIGEVRIANNAACDYQIFSFFFFFSSQVVVPKCENQQTESFWWGRLLR